MVWQEDPDTKEEISEGKAFRLGFPRDATRVYKNGGTNPHEAGPDRKGASACLQMVDEGLISHKQIMDGSFFASASASASGNSFTHLTYQKYSK